MHRLMAGVTILEHELSELRLLVERQTGILLDCPNSALAAHVADYLEKEWNRPGGFAFEPSGGGSRSSGTGYFSRWSAQREHRIFPSSRRDERAGASRDAATLSRKSYDGP